MIAARLINSDATINNYKQIGSISFLNGTPFDIVLQFYNTELGNRHLFQPGDTVNIFLQRLDGSTEFAPSGLPLDDGLNPVVLTDLSIFKFTIPSSVNNLTSTSMAGGNIIFQISNAGIILNRGVLFNALAREITDGGC